MEVSYLIVTITCAKYIIFKYVFELSYAESWKAFSLRITKAYNTWYCYLLSVFMGNVSITVLLNSANLE